MSVVLAGLGVVAFVFGLRHGLDANHIAAIDNTTRKLMQEGKRPLTVGTWFSLGHSTIVVGLIVALVLSTRAITGAIPILQSTGVYHWHGGFRDVPMADRFDQRRYRVRNIQDLQTVEDRSAQFRTA